MIMIDDNNSNDGSDEDRLASDNGLLTKQQIVNLTPVYD